MTRPSSDPHSTDYDTHISLDITDPICQVCGEPLEAGDDVTAYAYRAAGEPTYAIGYLMCGFDVHEHPTVFTRGVREDVLTGHIGTRSETQIHSTRLVLLDLTAVVTSPTSTAKPHVHPDAATPRDPTDTPYHEPTPLLTSVRDHARSDGGSPHGRPE